MASLRDIRRRIASVKNTRKITKAMEMVAAAKLRRSQARIEALRPYARDMIEMMADLATCSPGDTPAPAASGARGEHGRRTSPSPPTAASPVRSTPTSCARRWQSSRPARAGVETRVLAVGRKGVGTLKFRGCRLEKSWQGLSDRPRMPDARSIANELIELYLSGQVDRVRLVYTHFTSPIEQTLVET